MKTMPKKSNFPPKDNQPKGGEAEQKKVENMSKQGGGFEAFVKKKKFGSKVLSDMAKKNKAPAKA